VRVSSLTVERWRNLFGVHIEIPPDATLICLVGENGTGKSTILELLAQCAGTLGLAAGVQLRRPQLGNEPHDISLVFRLPDGFPLEAVEAAVAAHGYGGLTEWDGTLLYRSSNLETNAGAVLGVRAGGITDPGAAQLVGGQLVAALQQRREVNHLHIDADRAFNPAAIQDQEIWGLIRQDLRVPAYARQQASLLTQNMYSEWLKSMLATAVRYEGEYMELALQAQRAGQPVPMPEDPLASYRTALLEVLPHLRFERLDRDQRTLVYDSAGEELRYENLSGGEREIGFLIGQIERFQLRA
jgi:energy-coupling factor transporter ATP-binding protein EcfA2